MNKRARLEAYGNISLASGRTPPPATSKKPRDEIAKVTTAKPAPKQAPAQNTQRNPDQNRPRENTGQSFRMKASWREKIHGNIRLVLSLDPDTALPPYFACAELRPAKIGISDDILAYFEVSQLTEDQDALFSQAMAMFFGTLQYKRACSVGTHRFDISNTPVVEMTAEDIKHSRDSLQRSLQNCKNKQQPTPDLKKAINNDFRGGRFEGE